MKEVIGVGETLNDAKSEAIRSLALGDDDRIIYEILECPVKGFLGIFGSQPAKLKLKVEIKHPVNKIDTSSITSEETKARLLLGEDFDDAIAYWAGIYAVKINKDIMTSIAIQAINALWEKIGIEKGVSFSEKLKAFFLLIDENRLADEMDIIKRAYAGEFKLENKLEDEAQANGISVEQLIEIRKMELENAKARRRMQYEELKKLQEPAKKVQELYPHFDLELEYQNPLFRKLLQADIDMQTIFEVLNKDSLFQKKYQKATTSPVNRKTIDEFFDILKEHDDILKKYQSESPPEESEEELIKRAEECEISLEQLKEIKRLEKDNFQFKLDARINNCKKQAEEAEKLQHEYPLFNIDDDLSNPLFKQLVFQGIDLHIVYYLIHFDELYESNSLGEQKTTSSPSETKLFCRICGEKLPLDSKFCLHCGTQVIK